MIRCADYSPNPDGTATVFLNADTREEVPDDMSSVEVEGLPEGTKIAFFSKVMTTGGELGIRKSDDTWNWGD